MRSTITRPPVTCPVVGTDRPTGGDAGQPGLIAGAATLVGAAAALAPNHRGHAAEH